jgi:histidine phosphotransferase ChpT
MRATRVVPNEAGELDEAQMSTDIDIRILELLSGRLCHELISPIGAIGNGVELLGEDDPEFVRDATALIGESAKKAAQRLQFYRFAYGSLTGGNTGPDPRELVRGLFDGGKVAGEWTAAVAALATEWHKLACNMAVLAAEALPRGGAVRIDARSGGGVVVTAQGDAINVTEEARAAIARTAAIEALTSRTVQGYFSAHLAARLGTRLVATLDPGRWILSAEPGA